ncbi:MAG: Crp/Fnr family transcriptional regulator [Bacteroidaceae bacterium]|nr:Crp/Fnr family transcriptional regulator [Bacteroidaceae bacterium]
MYESLMCLPYFQGMSKDEITSILDKVKLVFTRHADGEKIVAQGSPCNCLMLLVRGSLTSKCVSPYGRYTLIEELTIPFAFEPYSLFGLSPTYRSSYYANGECDILTIEKSYLFNEFSRYDIFLMNIMNLLCQRVQQKNSQIWNARRLPLAEKIIEFIAIRAESQDGCKTLQIKMDDLADILDETRINVSSALNLLQKRGLIELRRKEIHIPSFKLLASYRQQTSSLE